MKSRATIGTAALLCALVAMPALGEEEKFDPFEVPKDYFSERVHTIALAPITVPVGIEPAAVREMLEKRLTAALEAKGYEVVSTQIYGTTWIDYSQKLGGVFDPVTGSTKEDIWATAYEYTTRDLRKQHDVDAVAFPYVSVAPLAAWSKLTGLNGTFAAANDELLIWKGEPLEGHAFNRPQRVLGTFLNLDIRDLNGDTMYGVRFPIEVTALYVASGVEEKPTEQLFQNQAWNQKAVSVVIDYLPLSEK